MSRSAERKQMAIDLAPQGQIVFPLGGQKPVEGAPPSKLFFISEWPTKSHEEILPSFDDPRYQDSIALRTGNNAVCLDIDSKKHSDPGAFTIAVIDLLDDEFPELMELWPYVQKTANNGVHVIFGVEAEEEIRNFKVVGDLIEVRATGGCALIADSPGYEVISGSLYALPTISNELFRRLIQRLKEFFGDEEEEETPPAPAPEPFRMQSNFDYPDGEMKPGKRYDERRVEAALETLNDARWKIGRHLPTHIEVIRPDDGHPTQNQYSAWVFPSGLTYVFTAATVLQPNTGYMPFALRAFLLHGEDFKACARELAERERKHPQSRNLPTQRGENNTSENYTTDIEQLLQDCLIGTDTKEPDWILELAGKKVVSSGDISVMAAPTKGGKTTTMSLMAKVLVFGSELLGIKALRPMRVAWIDSEQSKWKTHKIKERFQGTKGIDFYNSRGKTPSENWQILNYLAAQKFEVIFIDGIADFMTDTNDLRESKEVTARLLALCDKFGTHFFTVLHLNKAKRGYEATLRGHIGTELQNKAQTVFEVELMEGENEKFVRLKARFARENYFDPLDIGMRENGDLYLISSETGGYLDVSRPGSLPDGVFVDLLRECFLDGRKASKGSIILHLRNVLPGIGSKGTRLECEAVFAEAERRKIVTRSGGGAKAPFQLNE